jgi:four helix bundle protein
LLPGCPALWAASSALIMAQYEHLPIYKKAFDMTVYIENSVRGFSRYHKYTLGSDLRNLSRSVLRLIVKANSEKDKVQSLRQLRDSIEELKVVVRVGKEVKAYKNFNAFKQLIEEIFSLSRQCEGWLKSTRGT